jgi:hypothetical protein
MPRIHSYKHRSGSYIRGRSLSGRFYTNHGCLGCVTLPTIAACIVLVILLLAGCSNRVKIESGPIISDDFILYNYKDNSQITAELQDDGRFTSFRDYVCTSRGICAGSSLSDLAKRYGSLIPNYQSSEYGDYLFGATIKEFSDNYDNYKSKPVTIAFDDAVYGRLSFEISEGKVQSVSVLSTKAVDAIEQKAKSLVDKVMSQI